MFAQKLMWQAEISGITPDQWGGCSNGSAPDYATRKLITWEMARHCKTLLESFFGDLVFCFDRMMTKLSTIVAMKKGIPRTTCHSRSATVRAVKKTVHTVAGTSVASYKEEPDDTQMAGEMQGKCDVMALWTLISDSILTVHAKLCKGIRMCHAANWPTSSRCANAYVDDTGTYADHDGLERPPTQFDLDEGDIDPADDPVTEVIQNLQHSAQT